MTIDLREYKPRNDPDRNDPDRNDPDRNDPDRNDPDRNDPDRNGGRSAPDGAGPEPAGGRRPETGVPEDWVSQITLEDARRIYVKRGYERFAGAFARCDEAGGLQISLAVAPFFFGWVWFLYRKMYIEGVAILVGNFVLSFVVGLFSSTDRAYFLISMIVGLTLAMFGKGLYWKAVDRQIARAMALFPQNPRQALVWLEARGGVNLWIVLVVLVLFSLFVFMTVAEQVRLGQL